jgi:hypothetical protein
MDDVASKAEEYGAITISNPVLAPPSATFNFDLTKKADDYFADAKANVQGQSAVLNQQANSLALSATAQLDPTQIAAYAASLAQFSIQQQQYLQALKSQQPTTPPTAPTFPTAKTDTSNAPASSTGLAKQPTDVLGLLTDPKFNDAMALLSGAGQTPTLTDRSAVITAAGDRATQAIFTLLGDPTLATQFKDKRVVFGVSMVSVNPGWRTRKGFQAHISVKVTYRYALARHDVLSRFLGDAKVPLPLRQRVAQDNGEMLPGNGTMPVVQWLPEIPDYLLPENKKDDFNPLVAAVSPMTETQALDLGNSDRQQEALSLELAFALRYAGLGAQADAFEQFVKSRQQDVRTRTPSTAVNAFSFVGGTFGFEVGPRLVAIEDPARNSASGPANVLERQSFPTLIIFGMEAQDVTPRVRVEDSRYRLVEPQLALDTYPSWIPLDPRAPRLTETEQLHLMHRLRQATDHPDPDLPPTADSDRFDDGDLALFDQVQNRQLALSSDTGDRLRALQRKLDQSVATSPKRPPIAWLDAAKNQPRPRPELKKFNETLLLLAAEQDALLNRGADEADRGRLAHAADAVAAIEQQRSSELTSLKNLLDARVGDADAAVDAVKTRQQQAKTVVAKDATDQQKASTDADAASRQVMQSLGALHDLQQRTTPPATAAELAAAEKTASDDLNKAVALQLKAYLLSATAIVDAVKLVHATHDVSQAIERAAADRDRAWADYLAKVARINDRSDLAAAKAVESPLDRRPEQWALKAASEAASDDIRGWIADKIAHRDPALERVIDDAQERADTLRYRMFGGGSVACLPIDFVEPPAPAPTPAPKVLQVVPAEVHLSRNVAGIVVPQKVTLALIGSGLAKAVDTTANKYGDAAHPLVHGPASFDAAKPATVSQDVVLLNMLFTAAGPVVVQLPLQNSTDPVPVPPVSVTVDDAPTSQIKRLQIHLPWIGEMDEVDFSQGVPADVLKAELRPPYPLKTDGQLNVQIQGVSPQSPPPPGKTP